ncbi:MAG: hypothetical protein ACPLXB_00700 [Minisyncoccia bacterium]
MKEKKEKLRANSSVFSISPFKKNLFFFLIYSLTLIFLVLFSHDFWWIFLGLLAIFLWKIFSGLSWLNFNFFLLSLLLTKVLALFFNPFWLLIVILFLLFLLFRKIFYKSFLQSYLWRYLAFYYLFFFWLLASLGLYFFLNLSFSLSFIFFILGIIVFSLIYFAIEEKPFFPNGLIITLLNTEIFWLISYLSLPLSFLALLLFLNYWIILHLSYKI